MEVNIGEQMVGYNLMLTSYVVPGYEAIEDFIYPGVPMIDNTPHIKKGTEFIAIARIKEGGYLIKGLEKRKVSGSSLLGLPPMEIENCLAIDANGEPYAVAACHIFNPIMFPWKEKPKNFLKPKTMTDDKTKIWREASVIYAGKTKEGIRLIYQETALKDMEFTFDLSGGNIIAVKDLIFEILETTNISIKYIIKTTPEELKGKIEKREKETKAQDI